MKMIRLAKTLLCASFIFLNLLSQTTSAETNTVSILVKDPLGKPLGTYHNSHALVIAVEDYSDYWQKQIGTLKDASEIKNVLENLGFEVTQVNNPNAKGLRKELVDFINLHGQIRNNRLLIYFSGLCYNLVPRHGADEMEYLVPVGVPHPRQNLVNFRESSLSLLHLDIYARNILAKHTLFFLDGCQKGSALALFETNVSERITKAALEPVRQFILFKRSAKVNSHSQESVTPLVNALAGKADLNADGYIYASELVKFLRSDAEKRESKEELIFGALQGITPKTGDFIFPLFSPSSKTKSILEELALGKSLQTNQKAENGTNLKPQGKLLTKKYFELEHKQMVFWPPEETNNIKPPYIQEETFANLTELEIKENV